MRRPYAFKVDRARAACSILGFCLLSARGMEMATQQQPLELKQLGEAYPQSVALRASSYKGSAFLFTSSAIPGEMLGAETTFSMLNAASPGSNWKRITSTHQVVPAALRWDAAHDSNGDVEIVHERPGGAINSLSLWRASVGTKSLTSRFPLRDFSHPRFSKSFDAPPEWVTAVLDHHTCVALSLSRAEPWIELGKCAEGMLVKTPSGFVFLSKTHLPGPARGDDCFPGRLQARLLDTKLQAAAAAVEVSSDAVFQFDAAVIAGKLVVAATTADGIAVVTSPTGALHFVTRSYAASPDLFFPALLPASGDNASIHLLTGVSSEHARVLAAGIEIH